MIKQLILATSILGLVACGSDDESLSEINLDQFKGSDANPNITEVAAIGGDSVVLNSRITSTLENSTEIEFLYTASSTQLVAVFLTSSVEDLDLYVSGGDVAEGSSRDDSNEVVIFQAQADQTYTIGVESSFEGSFELTVVEATRATVGLLENEFLYRMTYSETGTCSNDEASSDVYDIFLIANFADGYLQGFESDVQHSFSKTSGYSFEVAGSGGRSGEDYAYSFTFVTRLKVNATSGELSGSEIFNIEDTSNNETTTCEYISTVNGGILL